jgi:hypothetical protein
MRVRRKVAGAGFPCSVNDLGKLLTETDVGSDQAVVVRGTRAAWRVKLVRSWCSYNDRYGGCQCLVFHSGFVGDSHIPMHVRTEPNTTNSSCVLWSRLSMGRKATASAATPPNIRPNQW